MDLVARAVALSLERSPYAAAALTLGVADLIGGEVQVQIDGEDAREYLRKLLKVTELTVSNARDDQLKPQVRRLISIDALRPWVPVARDAMVGGGTS